MDTTFRPHRGGIVLGLGILGLISALMLLPLGIVAWILGSKELRGMKAGTVDPSGRSVTQVGWAFGIVGTIAWIAVALFTLLILTATIGVVTTTTSDSEHPGTQHVRVYYPSEGPNLSAAPVNLEYDEVQMPNGTWVRDGAFVHAAEDGTRLEEGSYTHGRRSGHWTFRNADGSIDHAKTGMYENDVKVRD